MIAQRVLGIQNKGLLVNLERLSTGLRINRGKANMLVDLQSLVAASANEAGLSQEEKDANQLQIDSILETIDRLANDTSFQGTKLLNGSFDYTTEGVVGTLLTDVGINAAKLPSGGTLDVNVTMLQSAQTAQVYLSTAANFSGGGEGSITVEVTGNEGVQQFTFASGTSQANIISAINTFRDAIGVSAGVSVANGNRVEFRSTGFGTTEFVRVKELSGPAADYIFASALAGASNPALDDHRDFGRDAIVTINGQQATANGTEARVVTGGFDVYIDVDGSSVLNTNAGSGTNTTDFTITGGGANFNLSPNVNLAGKVSLGIETCRPAPTTTWSTATSRPPRRSSTRPSSRSRASGGAWVRSRGTRSGRRSTASASLWRTRRRPKARSGTRTSRPRRRP
jgi:flagellin